MIFFSFSGFLIHVCPLPTEIHTSTCVNVLCAGSLPNEMVLVKSGAVFCHHHRLCCTRSPSVDHLRHWIGIWGREGEISPGFAWNVLKCIVYILWHELVKANFCFNHNAAKSLPSVCVYLSGRRRHCMSPSSTSWLDCRLKAKIRVLLACVCVRGGIYKCIFV